jgi:spoIIIJ-associated protein
MDSAIEKTLATILDTIGAAYRGIRRYELAGQVIFSIETDDAKTLIGSHGDAVHALDLIVKKIIEKQAAVAGVEEPLFLVDVNDYRARHIKDLQTKALMMAERARSFAYDVELNPMSSYERLIVHATLAGAPNIKTESQGEGRERRVVIRYTA